jgi:hypothetical protein
MMNLEIGEKIILKSAPFNGKYDGKVFEFVGLDAGGYLSIRNVDDRDEGYSGVGHDEYDLLTHWNLNGDCLCGEINARHCPVHQEREGNGE